MITGVIALVVASAFAVPAQQKSLGAPGCGLANVKLDVSTERTHHALPNPEPRKALIVFLQDDAEFDSRPRPTTRFGIDGNWVGATQANSYFYVSVEPGEHHLCANWQSWVGIAVERSTAATHFTAEPGKTYYFRAKDVAKSERPESGAFTSGPKVLLDPLDSDEAQLLISTFSISSSRPRK